MFSRLAPLLHLVVLLSLSALPAHASQSSNTTSPDPSSSAFSFSLPIIIGIAVGGALIVTVVLLLVYLCTRKCCQTRSGRWDRANKAHKEALQDDVEDLEVAELESFQKMAYNPNLDFTWYGNPADLWPLGRNSVWKGFYSGASQLSQGLHHMKLELHMVENFCRISGDGHDEGGAYSTSGGFSKSDMKIHFTKKYRGRHAIHYEGSRFRNAALGMAGIFRIEEDGAATDQGYFRLFCTDITWMRHSNEGTDEDMLFTEDGAALMERQIPLNYCFFCLEAPIRAGLDPCGHMLGCKVCVMSMVSQRRRCPVCEAGIEGWYSIRLRPRHEETLEERARRARQNTGLGPLSVAIPGEDDAAPDIPTQKVSKAFAGAVTANQRRGSVNSNGTAQSGVVLRRATVADTPTRASAAAAGAPPAFGRVRSISYYRPGSAGEAELAIDVRGNGHATVLVETSSPSNSRSHSIPPPPPPEDDDVAPVHVQLYAPAPVSKPVATAAELRAAANSNGRGKGKAGAHGSPSSGRSASVSKNSSSSSSGAARLDSPPVVAHGSIQSGTTYEYDMGMDSPRGSKNRITSALSMLDDQDDDGAAAQGYPSVGDDEVVVQMAEANTPVPLVAVHKFSSSGQIQYQY